MNSKPAPGPAAGAAGPGDGLLRAKAPSPCAGGAAVQRIGERFAQLYYGLLAVHPSALRQFYHEGSQLTQSWASSAVPPDQAPRQMAAEEAKCCKGLVQIMDAIMASVGGQDPVNGAPVVVTAVDFVHAQTLPDQSGIMVHVTGFVTFLHEREGQMRRFSHLVFLEAHPEGQDCLVVRNGVVHYLDPNAGQPGFALIQQPALPKPASPAQQPRPPSAPEAPGALPAAAAPVAAAAVGAAGAGAARVPAPVVEAPATAPSVAGGSAPALLPGRTGAPAGGQDVAQAGVPPTAAAAPAAAPPAAAQPATAAPSAAPVLPAAAPSREGAPAAGLPAAAAAAGPAAATPEPAAAALAAPGGRAGRPQALPPPGADQGAPGGVPPVKLWVNGIPTEDTKPECQKHPVQGPEVRDALNQALRENTDRPVTGEVLEVDRKDDRKPFAFALLSDEVTARQLVMLSKKSKVSLRGEKLILDLSNYNTSPVQTLYAGGSQSAGGGRSPGAWQEDRDRGGDRDRDRRDHGCGKGRGKGKDRERDGDGGKGDSGWRGGRKGRGEGKGDRGGEGKGDDAWRGQR